MPIVSRKNFMKWDSLYPDSSAMSWMLIGSEKWSSTYLTMSFTFSRRPGRSFPGVRTVLETMR